MSTAAEIRTRLTRPWQHGTHADFRGVTCEAPLDLSGVAVDGIDFTGARFLGGIDASGARFDGLAWFRDVVIEGPARFDGAVFMNDARFEGARFQRPAGFRNTEFRGIGRFDGAQFPEGADLSGTTCYGNFSLQSVTGRGTVSFRGSEWLGGGSNLLLANLAPLRDGLTVPESAFVLFQMGFAVLAGAISVGAIAGRARLGWVAAFAPLWLLLVLAVAHYL